MKYGFLLRRPILSFLKRLFRFTLFLSLLSLSSLWNLSVAVIMNTTYDDSSPAIVYEPSSAHWFSDVTHECPQCPGPGMAINHTYHYGSHIVPPDADDSPADTAVASPTPQDPDAGPNDDANGQPDGDEHGDTKGGMGGGSSGGGKDRGRGGGNSNSKRRLQRRDDSDDPGFVDTPVNATLTFNGLFLAFLNPLSFPPFVFFSSFCSM